MLVKQHRLEFGPNELTLEMIYGACWHLGNPSCDREGISKFMERAKVVPWWHAGDLAEAIGRNDKRYKSSEHKESLSNQRTEASGTLEQANRTCLGLVMGNHEWGCSADGDMAEEIALSAKVPYLGACAYFDLICPEGKSLMFVAHGKGSMGFNSGEPERDDLNRRRKLRRILAVFEADVKCVAHYHRTIIDPVREFYKATVEGGEFKRRKKSLRADWVMACPSLFRNYDHEQPVSYAEMALYPPTDLGWLGIVFERSGKIACVREYTPSGNISQEIYEDVMR